MLHITKIDCYLGILTDKEVKDFAARNFTEYLKSVRKCKILEMLLNRFITF